MSNTTRAGIALGTLITLALCLVTLGGWSGTQEARIHGNRSAINECKVHIEKIQDMENEQSRQMGSMEAKIDFLVDAAKSNRP